MLIASRWLKNKAEVAKWTHLGDYGNSGGIPLNKLTIGLKICREVMTLL